MNILFVCTGTTCRSPVMSAIFNKQAKKMGLGGLKATSAGLFATDGLPMSENSKVALRALGVRVPKHKARKLTREIYNKADLVICVTDDHRRTLLETFPNDRKIQSIKSFVGLDDLDDPYGKNESHYYAMARKAEVAVVKIIEKLSGEQK